VAPSAIAASAAKLRKVERLVENLVERMDFLPAIGRLFVASRPAAMPGRDIAPAYACRLMRRILAI
jgi:hypothetical protein